MIVMALTLLTVAAMVVVVVGFDKLRNADAAAQQALVDVDLYLVRRADLVSRFADVVRGYAMEDAVSAAETAAHEQVRVVYAGDDVQARVAADSRLQEAFAALASVSRALPVRSVRPAVDEAQRLLSDAEECLRAARQHHDDCVVTLNRAARTVPWVFVRGLAAVAPRSAFLVCEVAPAGLTASADG